MTDHKGLPVHGYAAQPDDKVALVNENKILEERVLRQIEKLMTTTEDVLLDGKPGHVMPFDARWLHLAKTHIQQGFMAMNRAVFRPERVKLPED